ncbi:hypothetical protein GA0074692_5706 [Micromonospora pallida]|uniref:Uncharacterized protein n=1 Tax=Micromonospora pallida TaxID=145854 RepID=A0A1C6TFK2_9ACTN|nr:hypothetical protein [Micromonospora pallida]SCL40263.1 hypothetical protein GA0074692_5706 [Micromonospora pallida]
MRRSVVPVVALMLVCVLTACGGSGSGKKKRSRDPRPATTAGKAAPGDRDDDDVRIGTTPSPTKTPRRKVSDLTCGDLRDARVGSSTTKYRSYLNPLPLRNGRWTGNGATVLLEKPCATGDLDGDGAVDAVGSVVLDSGGSGRFWSLVVWRNVNGEPHYVTATDVGDRTPVQSIRIADQKATVVYLTRSPGAAMAELDLRRTAVHQLSGTRFAEVSHTDVPHTS